MEFLLFLDNIEIEIIRLVEQAGYSIEENTPLCLLSKDYVGFLKKRHNSLVICTNNIKERERYKLSKFNKKEKFERTSWIIKKALRHEAIHVAQDCNNGQILEMKKSLSFNPAKLKALNASTSISGEEKKEIQAYILEDRPKLVIEKLKKYCL